MCTSPPLPVHRYPRDGGGVDVVPHVLPIHIPEDAYEMTVAEWLDLKRIPTGRNERADLTDSP